MNEHPLTDDLTQLSSDDLDKRYTSLMKRYTIARRMSMNYSVIYQLEIMLESIENEKMRRLTDLTVDSNPVVIDTDPTE